MNKRRNVIFSVLLLLILAIAGFFIVDQLGRSQSAEDAAAGGSLCCSGGSCVDGTGFGEDRNGSAFGSCGDRAAQFCADKGGVANAGSQINCNNDSGGSGGDNGGGGSNNTCSGAGNAAGCTQVGQVQPIEGGSCRCTRIVEGSSACGCVRTQGSACPVEGSDNGCGGFGVGTSCGNNGTCQTRGDGTCFCSTSGVGDGGDSGSDDGSVGARCNSDRNCDGGNYCDGNRCQRKLTNNQTCSRNRECLSGICSGGRCASGSDTGGGDNGGTGGDTGGGSVGAGQACTPGANECQSGYACTVISANDTRTVCNAVSASDIQCTNGGTCDRILAFKCETASDFASDGSCFQGRREFNSFQAALDYIDGCGQVDTVCSNEDSLCGDFTIERSSCGGGSVTIVEEPQCGDLCSGNADCPSNHTCSGSRCTRNSCLDGNCEPDSRCGTPQSVTRQCGDTCSTDEQCPNFHQCTNGTCTKNICVNNTCGPDADCGNPLRCGDSCNENNECSEGHVCDAGTCKTNFCANNPASCSDGECTPATCGDGNLDPGEECEIGNEDACGAGSTCNTSTCQCDTSSCGDTCTVDSECPNDHSCDDGTCKLDACITDPGSCTSDSCEIIPEEEELPRTAIFGTTTDTVIFGILISLIGIVSYKVGLWDELLRKMNLESKIKDAKLDYEKNLIG